MTNVVTATRRNGMPHTLGSHGDLWTTDLRSGAVRWARTSLRYEETVAFYRDLLEFPVVDEFSSSYGEDGTIFGLPDISVHLEVVRAHPGVVATSASDQLVFYLEDAAAVDRATARLRGAGLAPVQDGHPYWEANGAVTYRDPDGRAIVFAPWVYGRVPDPVDRAAGTGDPAYGVAPRIDWYDGDRQSLRALFAEAEDSARELDSYVDAGRVLVALVDGEVVGHLQLVDTGTACEIELKSMAVDPGLRGTGIGTQLVTYAVDASRAGGYTHMVVATAAADIENLRFYQRRGFRLSGVERDAFGPDNGYAAGLTIEGIPLRDRVWFSRTL
jgi:GNAT superfamily N-acetyltransferase